MEEKNPYREFADRVANLFVVHPRISETWEMFDSKRVMNQAKKSKKSYNHYFMMGPSGVGKTVLSEAYRDRNKEYVLVDDEGTEFDIKPVVYLELPHPFTIQEFYHKIVKALGAPRLPGRPLIGEVKTQAFHLLESQRVEMLILDEIDFILSSKNVSNEEAMDTIKHVGNDANITLVCVGTHRANELRKLDQQYQKRFSPIRLETFKECDDKFLQFLSLIEEQLAPPNPIGLSDSTTSLPEALFQYSFGRPGYLVQSLQEAYRILGVYEPDFNDFSQIDLTGAILKRAFRNVLGDITDDERKDMWKDREFEEE
ncbi:TniB family NTP-binding protein [Brevibacillus reuszeri]|uniref:TniB family NTP-binding protein n=1 Tax=Brevibacillus reuszeri TaxID=54915 RepID=UPI002898C08E|nr:TniB family NTP-binding protein [Brevibacillus reuszeri]